MTYYDITRVERKTADYWVISSIVQKTAENRQKNTNGDYLSPVQWGGVLPIITLVLKKKFDGYTEAKK